MIGMGLPFGELLKWAGLLLAAGSGTALCAGLLLAHLRTSNRLAAWPGAGPIPPPRRRLIWRVGESPYHNESPRADTGVSRYDSPPLIEAEEEEEPGVPTPRGRREADKPPDPPALADTQMEGVVRRNIAIDPPPRRRMRGERKIVNLYLNKELYERFKERCRERGFSVSEMMEELISQYLGGL
jgi:hypothetical protein